MDPLREVMTIKEASELWRKPLGTIKAACMGQHGYPPRFRSDECRQSGKIWLITRKGMERVYGKQPDEQ